LPTLLGAQPPNYPKDYNRVETWGNLLDRFVWMFVHLTQKKVVGTARCMIPTLKPSCTASDIDSACFRSLVLLAPMPICGIWKVKYVSDTGSI